MKVKFDLVAKRKKDYQDREAFVPLVVKTIRKWGKSMQLIHKQKPWITKNESLMIAEKVNKLDHWLKD